MDALQYFAEVNLVVITYNVNSVQCGVLWVKRFTSEQGLIILIIIYFLYSPSYNKVINSLWNKRT